MVALTTFIGFLLPKAFATTSLTPRASITALTAPPAITPAPACAGFNKTREAPNLVRTLWCIVLPFNGIVTMFRRAIALPFLTASGTATPLPKPMPTRPLPSPTTTIALKWRFLPPFTTLATLLIWTTRSWNSLPSASKSISNVDVVKTKALLLEQHQPSL